MESAIVKKFGLTAETIPSAWAAEANLSGDET